MFTPVAAGSVAGYEEPATPSRGTDPSLGRPDRGSRLADPSGLPVVIEDGATAYVTGPGGLPVEQITAGGQVRFYHHDQQGSVVAMTDQTATKVASYHFHASQRGVMGSMCGTPGLLEA